MRTTSRRRVAACLIIMASLLIGGFVALAAAVGDTERITGYQVAAVLGDEGLVVTEVIDYDFGPSPRRGIYRDIPDAVPDSISVFSPTAPDDMLVTEGYWATEVRIGDPDVTIVGRHRYRIDYLLPFDSVVRDGLFSWDAIGTEWTVPINDIAVVLTLAGGLDEPTCRRGKPWDESVCELEATGAPGQFVTTVDSLDTGDGVTLSGDLVAGAAPTEFPAPPSFPISDPGTGILLPFLVATAAAILGGFGGAAFARRAGRERVWSGGAADAAFGDERDELSRSRIDQAALAELATIEFEPPRDTSAVEGGIVIEERVLNQHLSAWLLEAAIRGEIVITGIDEPVITRGTAPAHPHVHQVLDAMFGYRDQVTLDGYDKTFSKGWARLRSELQDWFSGAAHWDTDGRKIRRWAIGFGILGGLGALALTVLTTVFAAREGGSMAFAMVGFAALTGFAAALLISSSELLVRTEAGTALWLRVESFRRFLENSEARHVTEAAERGVLRHYTAWAVALGESRAWADAVEAAAASDPALGDRIAHDLAFVTLGSQIGRATSATITAPASSGGGGGGFSGSVGGGGGGGGGGSW